MAQGPAGELVILKLHRSVDWCLLQHRSPRYQLDEFADLRERLFGSRAYTVGLTGQPDDLLIRLRALEHWNDAWRRVKSRASEL